MAKVAVTYINININIITMYKPEDQGVTLKRIFVKIKKTKKTHLYHIPVVWHIHQDFFLHRLLALHLSYAQAAFHVDPAWAPVGPSWAPVGPRLGLTGAHLVMLLGCIPTLVSQS